MFDFKPYITYLYFRYITYEEITDFLAPPVGSMSYKEFNILYHVHLIPE